MFPELIISKADVEIFILTHEMSVGRCPNDKRGLQHKYQHQRKQWLIKEKHRETLELRYDEHVVHGKNIPRSEWKNDNALACNEKSKRYSRV